MIYTVTINPAVDYTIKLKELVPNTINRSIEDQYKLGGKGINVSLVLHNLGIENTALGFVGGFSGDFIVKRMDEIGIKNDFIRLESGISRINVKVKAGTETDINGIGPDIPKESVQKLINQVKEIKKGDYLVLAGNVPKSLGDNVYSDILEGIKDKEVKVVIDTTKSFLANSLKHKPFLVKPNKEELCDFFNKELYSDTEIITHAKQMQEMGAQNVLVSLGDEGAILVTDKDEVFCKNAPKGKAVNTVGAGDSMAAGFIAGYIEKQDYEYALKYGLAAGSASAFSENFASYEEIQNFLVNDSWF